MIQAQGAVMHRCALNLLIRQKIIFTLPVKRLCAVVVWNSRVLWESVAVFVSGFELCLINRDIPLEPTQASDS